MYPTVWRMLFRDPDTRTIPGGIYVEALCSKILLLAGNFQASQPHDPRFAPAVGFGHYVVVPARSLDRSMEPHADFCAIQKPRGPT